MHPSSFLSYLQMDLAEYFKGPTWIWKTRHVLHCKTPQIRGDLFNAVLSEEGTSLLEMIAKDEDHGAVENFKGQSLMAALLVEHKLSKAKILCDAGIDLDRPSSNHHTPLTEIANMPGNYTAEITFLCTNGASLEGGMCVQYDKPALYCAIVNNNFAHVACLLEHGAAVNYAYRRGFQPLTEAAHLGHFDCMRVLLEHGADVNFDDPLWLSPIDACLRRFPSDEAMDIYMPLLLHYGLDINTRCWEGNMFIHALINGNVQWAQELLVQGSHIFHCQPHVMPQDLIDALDLVGDVDHRSMLNKLLGESGEDFLVDLSKFQEPHTVVVQMAAASGMVTLQATARSAIRSVLRAKSPAINFRHQVKQLPLPRVLQNYLWFH